MWSKTKQRLESFLCPALKERVEYYCTMYRSAHDHLGRACIIVDNAEVLNCSDIEFSRKVCNPNSGYVRVEGGHCGTAEHKETGLLIYNSEAFLKELDFCLIILSRKALSTLMKLSFLSLWLTAERASVLLKNYKRI